MLEKRPPLSHISLSPSLALRPVPVLVIVAPVVVLPSTVLPLPFLLNEVPHPSVPYLLLDDPAVYLVDLDEPRLLRGAAGGEGLVPVVQNAVKTVRARLQEGGTGEEGREGSPFTTGGGGALDPLLGERRKGGEGFLVLVINKATSILIPLKCIYIYM